MSSIPVCSTTPRSPHSARGRSRSRRGPAVRTYGATTRNELRSARGSAAPRTCPRATKESPRSSTGPLKAGAEAALDEPAVAFKDKLNYKQPGGAGYSTHQDQLAYPGVDRVVSILVAIDDCRVESGCLWLADGVTELLPVDDRGVVREEVASKLTWFPAELAAGDAVLIDGLAPHYSQANDSESSRRVFIASYAPARERYDRARYYGERRDLMQRDTKRDGRFRISTLADFEGAEVATQAPPEYCTH